MSDIQMGHLGQNEVHVGIASLDYWQSELKFFESILSDDEVTKTTRFHFKKDRDRFVLGRGLLRIILSSYVGVPAGEIMFTYGSWGKPTLQTEKDRPAIAFNLAHSGGKIVFAITASEPIGVDIESIRWDFPVEQIADRFFSSTESAELYAIPKPMRAEAFFRCWTRKEAFVKALGVGLSCPLRDFAVSLAPGEPARLLYIKWDSDGPSRWYMKDIDSVQGCAAAMVLPGSEYRTYIINGI